MRKSELLYITLILLIISVFTVSIKLINEYENSNQENVVLADIEETNLPDTTSKPQLITPYYNKNHYVVADYVVKPVSGDATSTIKKALAQCQHGDGGTVWLERGIYNVSSPLTIPVSCVLMGDWQDPDNYQGTLDYGTKIVVDVNKFKADDSDLEKTGLFKLSPSSGVEGITVYYKNQSITKSKEQPWTFYYQGAMLFTVKNVTMINSYRGIGRPTSVLAAHEMLMIENVKGTVLKKGVVIHDSADVGTITGLSFSPKYLAKANLKAFNDNSKNSSESAISKAVKANGGFGIMITDVEQSQYVNINLSGFKYGVYIPNPSTVNSRYMGSGSFYNTNISDCDIGIMADGGTYKCHGTGTCSMIDYRWGYIISNSSISGTEYAIYNNNPKINSKIATFKLNDVSIKGKVGGSGSIINASSSGSYNEVSKNIDLTNSVKNTGKFSSLNLYRKQRNNANNFTYLKAGSSASKINNALSSIASKGGGVVYLQPGVYKIDREIIIPASVELRGSSSLSTRVFNSGTTFNVVSNVRAIKITGNNAGVVGINIIYEKNVNMLSKGSSYNNYDYSIFAEGSSTINHIYIKNISIAAASHGIYINKAKNFTVENIITGILDNPIRIDNSSEGLVLNILQNGNVICRNKLFAIDEDKANFNYIMKPNTYKRLQQVIVNSSTNIELQNIFAFGIQKSISANNSTVYAVNVGKDATDGVIIESNNSKTVLVNVLSFGSLRNNNSNLAAYNIAIANKIKTADTIGNIYKIEKKYLVPLLKPSETTVTFDSSTSKKIAFVYDGDGKITCSSSNTNYVKCSISDKEIVITPVMTTNKEVTITLSAAKGLYYSDRKTTIKVNVKAMTSNLKGDVNGDGKVSSIDYLKVKKHILGLSKLINDELKRADVNEKDGVTSADYLAIKKLIMQG